MSGLLAYVQDQQQYIGLLLLSHIQLTLLSVAIAVCIGVPLGIYISERERLLRPVMGFANLAQAIPSLALLGFRSLIWVSAQLRCSNGSFVFIAANFEKYLYRSGNISADTLEAAKGIGMTDMQVLFKVRLPLALPVIMAGIRISSVTAVGLMTIAAYIGAGGLGTLVISGIQTDNPNMILAGAIPACCLALLMDFLMSKVETAVTPVSLRPASKKMSKESLERTKQHHKRILAVAGMIVIISSGYLLSHEFLNKHDLRIGSKDATESVIIGNMLSDLTKLKPTLRLNASWL